MSYKIYKHLRALCNTAYSILIAFQMLMFYILFWVGIPTEQRLPVIIMATVPLAGYINLLYGRRMSYSKILLDKQGITNRLTTCKPISIAWDECVEIGLGKMPMGYGLYNVGIYFSKEPIPQKLRDEVQRIKLNDKHLWMQYDESAMEEVLKYVDESQIRSYHLRPTPKKHILKRDRSSKSMLNN